MMYCNFTIDGDAVSHQSHNTCIVISKNYFTSTMISIYNISTVILHYILLIKFYQRTEKSQTLLADV